MLTRGPAAGQVDIVPTPMCTATFSHAAGFDPPRLHLAVSVGMTRPRPNSATQSPFESVKLADRSVEDRSCGPADGIWDTRHQSTHGSHQSLTDCACCVVTAHLILLVLSRTCDLYRLYSFFFSPFFFSKLSLLPSAHCSCHPHFSALLALALMALWSWGPSSPLVIMTKVPRCACGLSLLTCER